MKKKNPFKSSSFWLGVGSLCCWIISEVLDAIKDDADMREIAKEVYKEEREKENS